MEHISQFMRIIRVTFESTNVQDFYLLFFTTDTQRRSSVSLTATASALIIQQLIKWLDPARPITTQEIGNRIRHTDARLRWSLRFWISHESAVTRRDKIPTCAIPVLNPSNVREPHLQA